METAFNENPHHRLVFKGENSKYFSIVFLNILKTILTLGFYYPWAKASKLKYLYENTFLENSPFKFSGTGKEMFNGFIKLVGIIIIVFGLYAYLAFNEMLVLAIVVLYGSLFVLTPLALHGTYKYRLSRTSWRGIHFGYRGDLGQLFSEFIIGILLTIVTIGIYSPWFTVKIRKYMLGNVRFGSAKFHYTGEGGDLLLINIKGYLLSIFTLGIYTFWWAKDRYNFYVNNIVIEHPDEKYHAVRSEMTGGDFFELFVVNFLIIIFTLGLGFPIAEIRTFKYITKKIWIENSLDFNTLTQTEEEYTDAAGEDLAGWLDVDLA